MTCTKNRKKLSIVLIFALSAFALIAAGCQKGGIIPVDQGEELSMGADEKTPEDEGGAPASGNEEVGEKSEPIRALKKLSMTYYSPNSETSLSQEYEYEEDGKVKLVKETFIKANQDKEERTHNFFYKNDRIHSIVTVGAVLNSTLMSSFTYDENGHITKIERFTDGTLDNYDTREISYDSQNKVWDVQTTTYDKNNVKGGPFKGQFNENGLPIFIDDAEFDSVFTYINGMLSEIVDNDVNKVMSHKSVFDYDGTKPIKGTNFEYDPPPDVLSQVVSTPTYEGDDLVKEEIKFTKASENTFDELMEAHAFEYIDLETTQPVPPVEFFIRYLPKIGEQYFKARITLLYANQPAKLFMGP